MRSYTQFTQNKHILASWHNFHWQVWFSYHNVFFGALIFRGRKALAFNLFLSIKERLKTRERFDPSIVFFIAMLKITPNIMLFPVKRSGVLEAAPFPISRRKQISFAVKWVIKLLKDSHRVVTVSRIVDLLISTIYDKGPAIRRKYDLYKRASSCRQFINFFR